jgi:hypothetical protein
MKSANKPESVNCFLCDFAPLRLCVEIMNKTIKYILGCLLHYANRYISFPNQREEFYKLKTKLLHKYGTKITTEIQHIKKECYQCDGTGIFKCNWKNDEPCWRCSKGVYKEFWTRLDKYKLGKFYFHNPVERMYHYAPLFEGEALPIIEGYIEHKTPKYRIGRECLLWLFLLFAPKIFIKEICTIGSPHNKWTPLVILGNIIFNIRHLRKHKLPF